MADKQTEEIAVQENKQLSDIEISEVTIKNLIYVVRGQQVMMDSDLATLYQVETRVLNQAVKRNIARFPEKFRFQLSGTEYDDLKSQFVISSEEDENTHGGRRKLPYVFTEQGIAMLSAVLRSETAVQVSIKIMDAFVEMRRFLASNTLMFEKINEMEVKQLAFQKNTEEKFDKIFHYISEHEESSQKIFFDGQIYDAFSLLVDLVSKAEKKLVLVDNYVDVGTLNILAKKKSDVEVVVYTVRRTRLSEADVNNFNQQYPKLEVKYTGVFHDRFLIIDDICAYHIGASIKDAGKKCFGISLIEDTRIVKDILERLNLESEEADNE
ncbi:MAG: ORF6N domain-containing protein [Clostridium sp.]|nr:ORF6N domain-containing protein [Clostridium sp.]